MRSLCPAFNGPDRHVIFINRFSASHSYVWPVPLLVMLPLASKVSAALCCPRTLIWKFSVLELLPPSIAVTGTSLAPWLKGALAEKSLVESSAAGVLPTVTDFTEAPLDPGLINRGQLSASSRPGRKKCRLALSLDATHT